MSSFNMVYRIGIWSLLFISTLPDLGIAGELLEPHLRRPVAIASVDDGRRVVTANYRSGSVSLINLRDPTNVHEFLVGKRLSSLVSTSAPERLFCTDEESHELILLRISGDACVVEKRIPVSRFPISVSVDSDLHQAFVACLWSRTICVVDLKKWLYQADVDPKSLVRKIHLPFCPDQQLVIEARDQLRIPELRNPPATRLLVADGFGSKLAIIDPSSGTIDSVREIPGHAIRAIQLRPFSTKVVISHQLLNRLSTTKSDDIHWGNLMANCLRTLDLADLLDPLADLLKHSVVDYLGGPDQGAADPAGFVLKANRFVGVALSGTDEFLCNSADGRSKRLPTGIKPSALALSPDGTKAFIANSLDDSVTVVDLAAQQVVATISLGVSPEPSAVDRGEMLFHSAKLSHDRWLSCASCHVGGHTSGLLNDNFTDESFGTAKRILSLRGVNDSAPYAWNGRFATLAEQVQHSVKSTMQGEPLSEEQTSDLVAFLRTLSTVPPIGSTDRVASQRGGLLFQKLNCARCHTSPAMTSAVVVDVNLKDERGQRNFNPPSLRGVSQNGPYFHDGRAKSLEDVFREFRHQLDRDLSSDELRDLVEYLNGL